MFLNGERLNFTRVNPGGDDTYTLLFGPQDDGVVEIVVTEGAADYAFVAELIGQDDAGTGLDASVELAEATTLEELVDLTGEVGHRDDGDQFLFEATAAEMTIEVAVDATSEARVGSRWGRRSPHRVLPRRAGGVEQRNLRGRAGGDPPGRLQRGSGPLHVLDLLTAGALRH